MTALWSDPVAHAGGELLVRRAPGAALICFNRPAKHNAFTDGMYAGLLALTAELAEDTAPDTGTRVVVFTGAGGRAFAAGNDIASFTAFGDDTAGADGVAYEAHVRRVLDAIAGLPQVTLAAVDGICVGGGLAVANACDLRICSDSARFGFPIAHTLGNALSAPLVLRCAEVWGDPVTREMLLTARLVEADRAVALGAVTAAVAGDQLEERAWEIVERVTRAAPATIQVTKEQLRAGVQGYDAEADDARLARAYGSTDFRGAVRAFLDKVPARFTG